MTDPKFIVKSAALQVGNKWAPMLLHYFENEKHSVYQFFTDDSYECVRELVPPEEALSAFNHYTNNVASLMGITSRVIITDGGDSICMEWTNGQGITYPPVDQSKIDPQVEEET